jgi:hypothetical protein
LLHERTSYCDRSWQKGAPITKGVPQIRRMQPYGPSHDDRSCSPQLSWLQYDAMGRTDRTWCRHFVEIGNVAEMTLRARQRPRGVCRHPQLLGIRRVMAATSVHGMDQKRVNLCVRAEQSKAKQRQSKITLDAATTGGRTREKCTAPSIRQGREHR